MIVITNKKDLRQAIINGRQGQVPNMFSRLTKKMVIPLAEPQRLQYPIVIRNKKDLRNILITGLKKGQC